MPKKNKLGGIQIYRGQLRTVVFTDEEIQSLITVKAYCARFFYVPSTVYSGIRLGTIVAKKMRGKWYLLPEDKASKTRY